MADLLLAEQVLLIGLDDEKGSSSEGELHIPLAGALLADLAIAGAVEHGDDAGQPVSTAVPEHPLLARTYELIGKPLTPHTVKNWVRRLPATLDPITGTIAADLVERGILAEQRHRILGLFPSTRYPECDPEPEKKLRARLHAVLTGGEAPDERDPLLFGLLEPLDMVRHLVSKDERRAARSRADAITDTRVTWQAMDNDVQVAAIAAVRESTMATTLAMVNGSRNQNDDEAGEE